MGVLDAQLHIGKETTYGTGVTPTRSFEPYDDGARRLQEYLESSGMRAGMETIRSDRRRAVNMGGEDSFEIDVLDKGLGMLLEAMLPTNSIAQVGATAAYLQTHDSGPAESGVSLTVQWGKPPVTGSVQPFTYLGGKVKSWRLTQDVGELLKLGLELDYRDSDTATALAAAAYPAGTRPYGWDDAAANLNSAAVPLTSFQLDFDNALDLERRFLNGSVLKSEPVRAGIPEITGEIQVEFTDLTQYNLWVAGTVIPIDITWTGVTIESPNNAFFKVTLAACQYDGDANPVASLSDLPRQPLPFKVLDNGTDPAVRIEYQSADTAF